MNKRIKLIVGILVWALIAGIAIAAIIASSSKEEPIEVKFDRRNFSNKMLKLGILTEVGSRPKNAGSRIPVNYGFNPESYAELKSKGFRLEF